MFSFFYGFRDFDFLMDLMKFCKTFKGPVTLMCIKNLDFHKVSLRFEKATLPNSDNGSSLGVDDVFGDNWNANFHVKQFLFDDFDFFSPEIGYQNFKHLEFHRFFIKKHYVF